MRWRFFIIYLHFKQNIKCNFYMIILKYMENTIYLYVMLIKKHYRKILKIVFCRSILYLSFVCCYK